MDQLPSLRPNNTRRTSRLPGGFDTDDEQSPTKSSFNDTISSNEEFPIHAHTFPDLDRHVDPGSDNMHPESQFNHDQEMTRHLMNVESSFLPDSASNSLVANEDLPLPTPNHDNNGNSDSGLLTAFKSLQSQTFDRMSQDYPDNLNTSSLETISSSPTAAAAARTVSRVVSMASMDGYETAREDGGSPEKGYEDGYMSAQENYDDEFGDDVNTPKKGSPVQDSSELAMPQLSTPDSNSSTSARRRPQYLTSRFSSNRTSRSSINTSTSNELESDMGTAAEYALQTGGATSLGSSSTPLRPDDTLSRSISLGSMASGMSQLGLDESQKISDLSVLQEEGSPPSSVLTTRKVSHDIAPQTPLRNSYTPDTITDTVLNQHVHGMNIPSTVVRNFARDFPERPRSPDRKSALNTPSVGKMKNMTLKEQSGMIDRLQKENWQLKLKVYYMDQMLNARTDEGMKSIMTENVALKTEKLKLAKDLRDAKRANRDLQAKLKDKDERLSVLSNSSKSTAQASKRDSNMELEREITVLHERIESYQTDIEKLREEVTSKDHEKNHLADIIKSMDEQHREGRQVDTSKEIQIWRDLMDTEVSQRQQVEDENRRLQEELWRLRSEASSAVSGQRSDLVGAARHRRTGSGDRSTRTTVSRGNSLLVEELRQEIEDLRRDLGAQTSMLTSRNREKEKLYQEIEELKMGHRQDRRSSSATRSRAHYSHLESQSRDIYDGEVDTETLRTQIDELRDAHAKMSMENQDLSTSIEGLLDELDEKELKLAELEKAKQQYDEFMKQTDTELLAMQSERDEALQAHEEVEGAFQDLREEAQQSIDILEDDLERSAQAMQKLEQTIKQRDDESVQLRNQVRMAHEGLDKIEADVQAKVRRINEVEMENQEITRELETIEDSLSDANIKLEKLSVELESRHSECAFLREEQDGFVLKIGDLETALKAAQSNLQSEKDKIKDLELRIANERQQQETVGSKEKQQVQKIMNDLNREATTAKDDARDLRKQLDTRNIELDSWKERLNELEMGLQKILGDSHGKSNYIFSIMEIQRKLESTVSELTETKHALSEKDRMLKQQDGLLEKHSNDTRRLHDLLEKEQAAHLADIARHERDQKTSSHSSRTISEKDRQIAELETARAADRKRLTSIEQRFKEQLSERNALLLSLWNKLSSVCGSDWQSQNSMVAGRLPSVDTIQNLLPGFSKNLLLAVKTIEQAIGGFNGQVRAVEKDLIKDYQQLEHNLNLRIKRLDRLESAVQHSRVSGVANAAPEIAKLRGENRMLKNEITTLQKQEQILRARQNSVTIEPLPALNTPERAKDLPTKAARVATASSLMRHYSTTTVETLQKGQQSGSGDAIIVPSQPIDPSQARWVHRLKDLERRLKAEREARLQDRKGAKERLEKGEQENEELRAELLREKEKYRASLPSV